MSKYTNTLKFQISELSIPDSPISPVGTSGSSSETIETFNALEFPLVFTNEQKLSTNISTNVLVGRHSNNTGPMEEIQIGEGIELNGNVLQIKSTFRTPTGVVDSYIGLTAPEGWLMLQGGTIGNASSGASERANEDTKNLFVLLWNSIGDANAPVSGGRGASALLDFDANKTIQLPNAKGKSILGTTDGGTGSVHGGSGGSLDHVHGVPGHKHSVGSLVIGTTDLNHSHTTTVGVHDDTHTHTFSATTDGGNMAAFPGQGNGAVGNTNRAARASSAGGANNTWDGWDPSHTHFVSGTTGHFYGSHNHTVTVNNSTGLDHNHTVSGEIGLTAGPSGDAEFNTESSNAPFLAMNFIIKL